MARRTRRPAHLLGSGRVQHARAGYLAQGSCATSACRAALARASGVLHGEAAAWRGKRRAILFALCAVAREGLVMPGSRRGRHLGRISRACLIHDGTKDRARSR